MFSFGHNRHRRVLGLVTLSAHTHTHTQHTFLHLLFGKEFRQITFALRHTENDVNVQQWKQVSVSIDPGAMFVYNIYTLLHSPSLRRSVRIKRPNLIDRILRITLFSTNEKRLLVQWKRTLWGRFSSARLASLLKYFLSFTDGRLIFKPCSKFLHCVRRVASGRGQLRWPALPLATRRRQWKNFEQA